MKKLLSLTITVSLGMLGTTAIGQSPEPMEEHTNVKTERPSTESQADALPRVILFANGRILEGVVTPHPEGGLNVQQKLGVIRVTPDEIEGVFSNLTSVYEYKRENLPLRDIQERMRLYRWCMSYGLLKQSKEQLQAVLALSPDHEEAKTLLEQLEVRIARQDVRTDRQVVRTSAVSTSSSGSRDDIDPAFLNRAMREMSLRNSPIIFDLPEPLALKRAQEFNQYIHPIVQRYCASCHNERTPNGFPLVSASGRAARDPAILRANLDATISLVNQENLMQSPLLTNSLLPHQPKNQPIFTGPNNTAYRLLANWVSNLQYRGYGSTAPSRSAANMSDRQTGGSAGFAGGDSLPQTASNEGGFASEGRVPAENARGQDNLPIPLNPRVMQKARMVEVPPEEYAPDPAAPGQIVPNSYNGGSPQVPKGTKFPVPITAGGSPDDLLKQLQKEEADRDAREAALAKLNDQPPKTPAGKNESPAPQADSDKPGTKPAKKPVKIDDKLLENFFLQRNAKD